MMENADLIWSLDILLLLVDTILDGFNGVSRWARNGKYAHARRCKSNIGIRGNDV